MSKKKTNHEKYLFDEELPLRSQWGIKDMKHNCLICGREVDKQEATDSSMKIRRLCSGESPYLWDVWVSDFCCYCVKRFNTWDDFVNFIKEHKNGDQI